MLGVPPREPHRDSRGIHRGVTGSFRAATVAQPRCHLLMTCTALGAHPPLGRATGCQDPPSLAKRPLTICVAGARGPCWPDSTWMTGTVQEARAGVGQPGPQHRPPRVLPGRDPEQVRGRGRAQGALCAPAGAVCSAQTLRTWGRPPPHWPDAGSQRPMDTDRPLPRLLAPLPLYVQVGTVAPATGATLTESKPFAPDTFPPGEFLSPQVTCLAT